MTGYVKEILELTAARETLARPYLRFAPNAKDSGMEPKRVSDRHPSWAKTPRRLRERPQGANRARSEGDALKAKSNIHTSRLLHFVVRHQNFSFCFEPYP
jgi:hypothetical protein